MKRYFVVLLVLMGLSSVNAQEWEFNKVKAPNFVSMGKTPMTISIENSLFKIRYHKRHQQSGNRTWIIEQIDDNMYATKDGKHIITIHPNAIEVTGVELPTLGGYTAEYTLTYFRK